MRGYLVLFAVAFGMSAIGLFDLGATKDHSTATVLTYVLVLVLTVGTVALHQFWLVAARRPTTSSLVVTTRPFNAPEALLYLNPFAADADLVCTTAPGADHLCEYMSQVTGKPYFGTPTTNGFDDTFGGGGEVTGVGVANGAVIVGPDGVPLPIPNGVACPPGAKCVVQIDPIPCPDNARCAAPMVDTADSSLSLGFPRDTFWPKSTIAFLALGLVLTFASAQLVSPTRRWRLRGRRLRLRRGETETPVEASSDLEPPVTEMPA